MMRKGINSYLYFFDYLIANFDPKTREHNILCIYSEKNSIYFNVVLSVLNEICFAQISQISTPSGIVCLFSSNLRTTTNDRVSRIQQQL